MSVIYSKEFATELERVFFNEFEECREVTPEQWNKTGMVRRLSYAGARLVSSLL